MDFDFLFEVENVPPELAREVQEIQHDVVFVNNNNNDNNTPLFTSKYRNSAILDRL